MAGFNLKPVISFVPPAGSGADGSDPGIGGLGNATFHASATFVR